MSRRAFIVKRFLASLISIFAMVTIIFLMFRLIPGDPTVVIIDGGMAEETQEMLRERYGLDEPLYIQYIDFLQALAVGDLGVSFRLGDPVSTVIAERLPNTLVLMIPALVLAFLIGPLIGAYLGWVRGTLKDSIGVGAVLLMYAAPVFWTGMLGIMVFAHWLGWLPSGGMHGPTYDGPHTFPEQYLNFEFLRHLVMPLIVTTLFWLASPAFFMRNTIIDVLGSDFIEMNRAQGLSPQAILYKHGARNSLLPVLHFAAVTIGIAMGGSIIIETVFSWPGIGRLMWEAVEARDYPVAQGVFILMATIVILANFVVDLLSVYVDPRVVEEEVSQ